MPEAANNQAPVEQGPPVEVIPASSDTPISARDAAAALSQYRWKRDAREERSEEAPEPAPIENTAADQPVEAPAEQPTEADDPAKELPPIDPPRSWSKEEKEEFNSYSRELQERLARREQERDAGLRRGQNETAEQRKAIEAERMQLEQARRQYEEILPQLLTMFQQGQQGEFADIKSMADVENLARTDWARYIQWDAHQKKVSALQKEMEASQTRRQEEFKTEWARFAKTEDEKFLEAAPEMANKDTAAKIASQASALLETLGFSESDISNLWEGRNSVSLRDHRVQLLIRDALRYREAKSAVPKAKTPAPAARVQKPGTPAERMSDTDAQLKNLNNQLNSSGKWKDAAELLIATRAARR